MIENTHELESKEDECIRSCASNDFGSPGTMISFMTNVSTGPAMHVHALGSVPPHPTRKKRPELCQYDRHKYKPTGASRTGRMCHGFGVVPVHKHIYYQCMNPNKAAFRENSSAGSITGFKRSLRESGRDYSSRIATGSPRRFISSVT